jgi:hypothetical protein
MLDSFKRLISRHTEASPWPEVQKWVHAQKMVFNHFEDMQGFWIEGGLQSRPWRLEWGPPQRQYIEGTELRMRIDLGASMATELQMLLLSRTLFESLEHNTFERYTETTQTLIDTDAPEEMRWLVMYPATSFKAPKAVRSRFQLLSSTPLEAAHWVEGELARRLETSLNHLLIADPAFLLMVLHQRIYLRMQLIEPELAQISQALSVFETAILQALHTATLATRPDDPTWAQTTAAGTAWQTQPGRGDIPPRDKLG